MRMIDWRQIDTVLLDMDGTVLDLHFDNVFWSELLPERYASSRRVSVDCARRELFAAFEATRHSLSFYCLDHWTRLTGLDLIPLKEELAHLIRYRPGSETFLVECRRRGKRLWLVTNAHRGSVGVKHGRTGLLDHFDGHVSAHDFGAPKESAAFWQAFSAHNAHDPARTLLVDDNLVALRRAGASGIRELRTITQPDSREAPRQGLPYPAINRLDELL